MRKHRRRIRWSPAPLSRFCAVPRVIGVVGIIGVIGCAGRAGQQGRSIPQNPPSAELEPVELAPERVARLRAAAPELANVVERLAGLANATTDPQQHRELADLARIALLSGLAQRASPEDVQPEPNLDEQAVTEAEGEAGDAAATGTDASEVASTPPSEEPRERPRVRRPRPAPAPVDADEVALASEDDAVRRRLSDIASRLSAVDVQGDQEIVVQGIQTALIEGDRALSEGVPRRAAELADEAERLLASLTGGEGPRIESTGGFRAAAREHLGERARYLGGAVLVRLDDLVRFSRGRWRGSAEVLGELGSLVRTYRSTSLSIVTVGSPTEDAFDAQREALQEHLVARLRVDGRRVRWGGGGVSVPRGTWLVVREAGAR